MQASPSFHSTRARGFPQRVAAQMYYGAPGALKTHIYVQREGIGLDGKKPELFTEKGKEVPTQAIEGEPRLWRVMVSPEKGQAIHDLQQYTRDFMHELNLRRDGDLLWCAAAHYNNGHPHSHILIRGLDSKHQEVFFDPHFVSYEARRIASQLATLEIGHRTEWDIRTQISRELVSERYTSIDRGIYIYATGHDETLQMQPRNVIEQKRT